MKTPSSREDKADANTEVEISVVRNREKAGIEELLIKAFVRKECSHYKTLAEMPAVIKPAQGDRPTPGQRDPE